MNPRAVTAERFEQLEAKVDELLRLVRGIAAAPAAATQVVIDDDRGTFLPGTGWLRDAAEAGRTPEALPALEQFRQRDGDT